MTKDSVILRCDLLYCGLGPCTPEERETLFQAGWKTCSTAVKEKRIKKNSHSFPEIF